MKKTCRKCEIKASPKPLFYFSITQNNHCMQGVFLKTRYYGKGYQKVFKNLTLFFLANPVHISGQSYKK